MCWSQKSKSFRLGRHRSPRAKRSSRRLSPCGTFSFGVFRFVPLERRLGRRSICVSDSATPRWFWRLSSASGAWPTQGIRLQGVRPPRRRRQPDIHGAPLWRPSCALAAKTDAARRSLSIRRPADLLLFDAIDFSISCGSRFLTLAKRAASAVAKRIVICPVPQTISACRREVANRMVDRPARSGLSERALTQTLARRALRSAGLPMLVSSRAGGAAGSAVLAPVVGLVSPNPFGNGVHHPFFIPSFAVILGGARSCGSSRISRREARCDF